MTTDDSMEECPIQLTFCTGSNCPNRTTCLIHSYRDLKLKPGQPGRHLDRRTGLWWERREDGTYVGYYTPT